MNKSVTVIFEEEDPEIEFLTPIIEKSRTSTDLCDALALAYHSISRSVAIPEHMMNPQSSSHFSVPDVSKWNFSGDFTIELNSFFPENRKGRLDRRG